jgi:hypothetical protein
MHPYQALGRTGKGFGRGCKWLALAKKSAQARLRCTMGGEASRKAVRVQVGIYCGCTHVLASASEPDDRATQRSPARHLRARVLRSAARKLTATCSVAKGCKNAGHAEYRRWATCACRTCHTVTGHRARGREQDVVGRLVKFGYFVDKSRRVRVYDELVIGCLQSCWQVTAQRKSVYICLPSSQAIVSPGRVPAFSRTTTAHILTLGYNLLR